jgi:hypothetical protein
MAGPNAHRGSFVESLEAWGRLIARRSSAVRTIDIIYANQALALRTARAQFVVAARAEVESVLDLVPTLRAGTVQRLPQDEVQDNTQAAMAFMLPGYTGEETGKMQDGRHSRTAR